MRDETGMKIFSKKSENSNLHEADQRWKMLSIYALDHISESYNEGNMATIVSSKRMSNFLKFQSQKIVLGSL